MKNILFFVLILLLSKFEINAQSESKRVLFIGNSYTYVNNLPQMIANIANLAFNSQP